MGFVTGLAQRLRHEAADLRRRGSGPMGGPPVPSWSSGGRAAGGAPLWSGLRHVKFGASGRLPSACALCPAGQLHKERRRDRGSFSARPDDSHHDRGGVTLAGVPSAPGHAAPLSLRPHVLRNPIGAPNCVLHPAITIPLAGDAGGIARSRQPATALTAAAGSPPGPAQRGLGGRPGLVACSRGERSPPFLQGLSEEGGRDDVDESLGARRSSCPIRAESRSTCAVSSPISRYASASRTASSAAGRADSSSAEGTPATADTTDNDHHSGQPVNNLPPACRQSPTASHQPSRHFT